jgi:hypothetical protein
MLMHGIGNSLLSIRKRSLAPTRWRHNEKIEVWTIYTVLGTIEDSNVG